MKRIVFVCHGNICRSTMAEFLFRHMVDQKGISHHFDISSRATSTEELGNPVHPGTARILSSLGISTAGKRAQQITAEECNAADRIVVMDRNNIRNLQRFIGNNQSKVSTLLSYAGLNRDISDPWYTGNFDETYRDVELGCRKLLEALIPEL